MMPPLQKIMDELGVNIHMAQRIKEWMAGESFAPARGSMACFYYGTEWREERPDQPGWWWCLGPNRIVHVMRQRAFGDRLCAHMISEWMPVDEIENCLWAGPIPQPKEP